MIVTADLHVHSCLSPCGDLTMSPARIASTARHRGISLLALTDHNSTGNLRTHFTVCRKHGIEPIAGIEITSREEIHCLALFETPDQAEDLASALFRGVPHIPYDPSIYGDQPVVDEHGSIVEMVTHYLQTPTRFSFDELPAEVHRRGGLFIPAHIDRSYSSVSSQLGFLPEGNYDAVEVTRSSTIAALSDEHYDYPCTVSSDAHRPEDIGRRVVQFEGNRPGFSELRSALTNGEITRVGQAR